ncbi:MAG TPA: basic amino acid ABC transporter substrate-binding protein [Candidatus Aphodousia faecipullorum]|nr:basic amino acid ABC transporter substrate-binding protein [Candidatus Aphodousia faecipullorum]
MKKILTALMIGSLFSSVASAGTLLVGTDAGFAPFEYKDPKTNEIVGFDIDLITAMAKAVGDDVKIQNMQFAGIIPALQTNMIDVAAAALTITAERQKQVLFTDPYYDVGLVMVIRKKDADKYKTLDDMQGKRICSQIGTTGAILGKQVKGATVGEYDQMGDAMMELKMNGCDSVLVDKTVTEYYIAQQGDKDIMMVPHLYNPKQNGFAVSKRNTELAAKLNKGLKIIRENGEYDKIYEKWFGKKAQ